MSLPLKNHLLPQFLAFVSLLHHVNHWLQPLVCRCTIFSTSASLFLELSINLLQKNYSLWPPNLFHWGHFRRIFKSLDPTPTHHHRPWQIFLTCFLHWIYFSKYNRLYPIHFLQRRLFQCRISYFCPNIPFSDSYIKFLHTTSTHTY